MKRKISLDVLRILACFMVIVNHTMGSVFFDAVQGKTWFASNFAFNCCRMNVVTFIFISGSLLLEKEESCKYWFKKRILRTVLVIVLFSWLYYPLENFDLLEYICQVFSRNLTNAYWYLYLYLALMLCLPMLRCFVKAAGKKEYRLLFLLFILIQSVYPILTRYCGFPALNFYFSQIFTYWGGWIVIFLAGHYFKTFHLEFTYKRLFILAVIWLVGNLIPTFITYRDFSLGDRSLFVDNPFLLWSILATFAVIFLITMLFNNTSISSNLTKIISYLAGSTFGIYLLSDKFISLFSPVVYSYCANMNVFVATVLLDILVFAAGAVITMLLKSVPFVKKLL